MILDTLAAASKKRAAAAKEKLPMERIMEQAFAVKAKNDRDQGAFPFEKALSSPAMSFICEVKKASPSKGIIAADFPYVSIAQEYEEAGASAISVLTEPEYFLGSNEYLAEISRAVSLPLLRKDFTVDPYQIYEATVLGASAVLLICSILSEAQLKEFIRICDSLGLSALAEAHNEEEIKAALSAGARIIGVNNRNLKDFTVDFETSLRLRSLVPSDVLFLAESGVKSAQDVKRLWEANVNGVLIGETLMRAPDKKEVLNGLKRGCCHGTEEN